MWMAGLPVDPGRTRSPIRTPRLRVALSSRADTIFFALKNVVLWRAAMNVLIATIGSRGDVQPYDRYFDRVNRLQSRQDVFV